ncbi:hypothetical protein DYB37_002659 [Aphanomyces astaci]|uniref:HECT-type E3 ubiquitin transferase n=1 Tax=Aphanomyces astaci TaxID=112090 RepID=A0A3R7ANQ1_APHAT|nr:hypothetical protein DYB37_002659 [Aphanomyces astaci]
MGVARSHRGHGLGAALGLFEKAGKDDSSSPAGISSAALEALANDKKGGVKLVDTLQAMTHNLAMTEASAEGGLGLLMGRPKFSPKTDPHLVTVLSGILKTKAKFALQPRLLACQSLNYLIKLDIRMSDGKKASEYMAMYLDIMDEVAMHHQHESLAKHLAEEATNGLEVACQSHPAAFRDLCQPDPLAKLLGFLTFASTMHVNVLLTTLSLLQKVCQRVHFHTKPPSSSSASHRKPPHAKPAAPQAALPTIMAALETYIGHINPRVQVGAIKCMTVLFHRTPLHEHLTTSVTRQLLHIMVAPSTDDGGSHDASRAAVALLSELLDESPTVFTTLVDPDVARPLMQQLGPMLQTESVATPTLRFLSKVAARITSHQANESTTLQKFLLAFVKANAVATVSSLLKDGATLHSTSPSPFLVAVTTSSVAMVRLLIRKGAHVSVEALHAAADARRCDVVLVLLQHGASPNAANEHGETLHQVLAKPPPNHPVTKLLAAQAARLDVSPATMDHEGVCDDGHHHSHGRHHPHRPSRPNVDDVAVASASGGLVLAPPSAGASASLQAREVLIEDFTRAWNDMEEDESDDHFDDDGDNDDDDDMHSEGDDDDDDEDAYHEMYGDESHEDDGDEEDDSDDDEDQDMTHDDEAHPPRSKKDAKGIAADVRDEFVSYFTHALFTSLVHAVAAVDNKHVTHAVLSTLATVLVYPIVELTEADLGVLLEVIHGLLMETPCKPASGDVSTPNNDADGDVYPTILALRLLQALSAVQNPTVVRHMERQGILERLRSIAEPTHTLNAVDAAVSSLVSDWLDTLQPLASTSLVANPVVARLNALCEHLETSCDTVLDDMLSCIDDGVTTYELTKSAVVPTLLQALSTRTGVVVWTPKWQTLVRHLHQVVGLHESLPVISYAMAKGKEFYPLTRQLRLRMRVEKCPDAPPRSIHASPLTLFSSFERTVFRCATLRDPQWLQYAWSLVGHSIWKPSDGKWVEATVCGFESATGCHLVHCRDEYVEEVLHEETYRLVKSLRVCASVSMDLSVLGRPPVAALKRTTPDDDDDDDDQTSHHVRRSKRIKRQGGAADDVNRDDDDAVVRPRLLAESSPPYDKARSREQRLMDVLRLQDMSATPTEGDKVWVSSNHGGSLICVCGTFVKKTTASQVEVQVSFGSSQVNVPLVVDEANVVTFQAKARPGSAASSKGILRRHDGPHVDGVVQRMLGALDSHGGRNGGRPVLEHLRRLLSRPRHSDHIDAEDESSTAAAASSSSTSAAASSTPPSRAKKNKQKAAAAKPNSRPTITAEDELFTTASPPVVRVLLGLGESSDKSDDQLHWLTPDGARLNDVAVPVARWLFQSFAAGQVPAAKPSSLEDDAVESDTLAKWSLAEFSGFCKQLKLGLAPSEEYLAFSGYATTANQEDVLTWAGFSSWLVDIVCKDAKYLRSLGQYLEHLGFEAATFQSTAPSSSVPLMEFAPDDNLFQCLTRIHPSQSLGLVPWKCVFNVFCDFQVRWKRDDVKPATALATSDHSIAGPPAFTQCVRLLQVLHDKFGDGTTKETWLNPQLSRKLRMQLQDVLSVTSGTYPSWCDELVQQFLFPLEMRYTLFRTTAFGFSRSLHWFRDHLESTNDELTISPLPKERAKVDRSDILHSADAVLKVHAKRKAVLDIVFVGERGYGSGVTAAFYSAVAHALQCNATMHVWRLAGKALQDERLLPLPLSSHFLKLVFGERVDASDLAAIFLEPGRILSQLHTVSKALLQTTPTSDVRIENMSAHDWLAAVDLNFVDPITQAELVETNGSAKAVTVDNLHLYVALVVESWLGRGISSQVQAFQEGLGEVVPLTKLKLLFVDELQLTLCGTADVEWTHESLRQTIKLAHGYTSSSEPIEHFIEVLVDMTTAQRRAFLLYATGCPNLPPGGVGFEKLKPQFEVVRRVSPDGQAADATLPFARTCTNTLHLPAYSTKAVLAKQLEYAVLNSKGVIDRD